MNSRAVHVLGVSSRDDGRASAEEVMWKSDQEREHVLKSERKRERNRGRERERDTSREREGERERAREPAPHCERERARARERAGGRESNSQHPQKSGLSAGGFITEGVFKVILQKSILHKSVNLFFISVMVKDKLTDLCGN